jgi:hypothetical protein
VLIFLRKHQQVFIFSSSRLLFISFLWKKTKTPKGGGKKKSTHTRFLFSCFMSAICFCFVGGGGADRETKKKKKKKKEKEKESTKKEHGRNKKKSTS